MSWNLETDSIIFTVPDMDKSFTKCGVSSAVNSIYDPFSFSTPDVVKGKLLLRQMTLTDNAGAALGWDEPLPEHFKKQWDNWSVKRYLMDNKVEWKWKFNPSASTCCTWVEYGKE